MLLTIFFTFSHVTTIYLWGRAKVSALMHYHVSITKHNFTFNNSLLKGALNQKHPDNLSVNIFLENTAISKQK